MDCYSPGQGLMPASFKVRTMPLDGRNGEFEDVLDPDFGESAIGRVAPVDSGEAPISHHVSLFLFPPSQLLVCNTEYHFVSFVVCNYSTSFIFL